MAYRDLIRADTPSLYWPLDATYGATDQSGNGRNGSGQGGVSIGGYAGSPISGQTSATDLDGNLNWISSTYAPFVAGSVRSFEGWAYRDNSAGFDVLIGGGGAGPPFFGLGTFVLNANDVIWLPNNAGAASYGSWGGGWPGNAQWVHWVLVFNDATNTADLYLNGVAQAQKTGITDAYSSPGNFSVGINSLGNPFDGKMAHVAVYERALTPSEVKSHYLAAAATSSPLVIREKPPLRWAVRATAPSGQKTRWAMDEKAPSNRPGGSTCSDTIPGGFETFQTTLLRRAELAYPDIERLTQIDVEGVGGQKIWQGRVESAPRDTDALTFKPEASGFQSHLDDFKGAREIYIDRNLEGWQEPTNQRKINLMTASPAYRFYGSWEVGGQDGGSATPGIVQQFTRINTTITTGPFAVVETWYYGGGVPLGELRYDYDMVAGLGADWNVQASLSSDDLLTAGDAGTDHHATDATNQSVTTTATNRRWSRLFVQYSATTVAADGQWTAMWKNPRTFGTHGLTKQGTAPAEGFLASDVIANAISRWAPKLQYTTGANGSIQPSSFVIPHLEFKEATTAGEIVKAANRFELGDWAVWDGPGGLPTFFYNARGARGRAWKARVAPNHLEEAGPSIDRLWNGIFVKYQDVDGTQKIVGPTGTVADATSADLLDTDPLNPANKAGIQRYDMLDMGGVSTSAAAIEVGRRFLVATKDLDQSGKATINGYLTDDRGIVHPYHQVRAGDTIAFVDASDPSPRRVVRTEKDLDARTCSVDLDAPPEGLQALLEQMGVVLIRFSL